MPSDHVPPPAPPAPPSRALQAILAAGGAGVAMLVALAVLHNALAVPLLVGAVLVAAATVAALAWAARSTRVDGPPPAALQPSSRSEASNLFQEALDGLIDPVMVIEGGESDDSATRRIVFANRAARDLFRIQREGGLLVTAVRDPEVLEVVEEALYGGPEIRVAEYQPGGAADRYWRASSRGLTASGGRPRALLRLRDETDARRVEQMRVDLLANASHELRTPLASLTGFIETLKGHARDDPEARDRFLDIMAAQAERMKRLIADLLSLSRIELNEHIPPSGRVDLALVAVDVVDALGPLAKADQVSLRLVQPDPGAAMITGDRDEVVQVVQNLIDHAVKYSPPGGVVEIEVEAGLPLSAMVESRVAGAARFSLLSPDRDGAVRYSRLSVRDHGPGLEREHLPRLTERFYRVEGQKSGARPGTGLGLAIAKHILNRHRGGMTVESRPGEGANFSIYLPAAPADGGA